MFDKENEIILEYKKLYIRQKEIEKIQQELDAEGVKISRRLSNLKEEIHKDLDKLLTDVEES